MMLITTSSSTSVKPCDELLPAGGIENSDARFRFAVVFMVTPIRPFADVPRRYAVVVIRCLLVSGTARGRRLDRWPADSGKIDRYCPLWIYNVPTAVTRVND